MENPHIWYQKYCYEYVGKDKHKVVFLDREEGSKGENDWGSGFRGKGGTHMTEVRNLPPRLKE